MRLAAQAARLVPMPGLKSGPRTEKNQRLVWSVDWAQPSKVCSRLRCHSSAGRLSSECQAAHSRETGTTETLDQLVLAAPFVPSASNTSTAELYRPCGALTCAPWTICRTAI